MSTTSSTAQDAAANTESAKKKESQGRRHDLWGHEPTESEVESPEHSFFDSKPQLNIGNQGMSWPKPGESLGTHHASFGDNGTTATVSRYGEIMQVSHVLGKGRSCVFSMDHTKTREPHLISDRARDLDGLSETTNGNYSYGLFMNGWPDTDPEMVEWVNWRWPRYVWKTGSLRTIFQYYVHDGIVLHQLLFHNDNDGEAETPEPEQNLILSGYMRVQDVDYLSSKSQYDNKRPEDEKSGSEITGPCGYGRVQRHSIHRVVGVIDVFIDGHRTKIPKDQNLTLEPLPAGGIREIVVAYSLSLLPDQGVITWQNFMIPAAKANVGKLLRDELENMGSKCIAPDLLDLPRIGQTTQHTSKKDAGDHDGGTAEAAAQTDATQTDARHNGGESAQRGFEKSENQLRMVQYLTARHLEHILSVCAIPVPCSHDEPTHPPPYPAPVALTCGDMSGHRICTSASYYAFLFLIQSERRLAEVKKSLSTEHNGIAHIDLLRKRIRQTCEGHIMWLENAWKNTNPDPFTSGHFVANYWATGHTQDNLNSDTWQPPNSVTDTAFQILKITEYARAYEMESARPVQSLLTQVFVAWLHDLDRLDPREKFAWARPKREGVDTFRLEDHFWVWRALKALEARNMWSELPKPEQSGPNVGKRDTIEETRKWAIFAKRAGWYLPRTGMDLLPLYNRFFLIAKRLVPREVQRGILQHFTTVIDGSGVLALAVNRSSRETRFLLHDRDSALLYDQDGNSLFSDEAFGALWQQTLKSQRYHPANEESDPNSKWYTAMRYALSIMMGARGSAFNGLKASNAVSASFETVLSLFNHNGFLGEQLSWSTKEPVIFDDDRGRDSHFHASFEVVYVLLTHAKYVQQKLEEKKDSESSAVESDHLANMLQGVEGISSALKEVLAATKHQSVPRPLKERIPFNNHIVSSNVWPIEEEWLYNYPEFFSAQEVKLGQIPSSAESGKSHDEEASHDTCREIDAMIVDAKKQKEYGKPRKRHAIPRTDFSLKVLSYKCLERKLETPRRAGDAKKRFIWVPNANHKAAGISQATRESEAERRAISLFFTRHFQCEYLVYEDTSLALNTWNTELHLNFQCLVDQGQTIILDRDRPCISEHGDEVYCVLNPAHVMFPQSKNKRGKILRRDSMSYRFNGDLFDRYWTCHFIESSPFQLANDPENSPSLSSPLALPPHQDIKYTCSFPTQDSSACCECGPCSFLSKDDRTALFKVFNKHEQGFKTWWQRRILEILLLQRMLDKIFKNTRSILREIENSLLGEKEEDSLPHPKLQETYKLWLDLVPILGTIEDDLTSILDTLQKWDERAIAHGIEKPRWTLNDEKKYRRSIQVEQALLEKRRSDVLKQNQRAKSLQTRCKEAARRLQTRFKEEEKAIQENKENNEKERAIREKQSERNIRWFTYVTIVFAPLSFAQGFYSMGGAPSQDLTRSLAIFSVVALIITVVVLFGAIKTFSVFEKIRGSMESGNDGRSRKASSVSEEEDELKTPDSGEKSLHSARNAWLSTVLDRLVNVMLYPVRLWEREREREREQEREHEKLPSKPSPLSMLGLAFGIIVSPFFVILWLIQFFYLSFLDLCLWLNRMLHAIPQTRSKQQIDVETGTPKNQLRLLEMRPPQ